MDRLSIDTLVEDVYSLFTGGGGKTPSPDLLDAFGKDVTNALARSVEEGSKHSFKLRLSSIGKPLRRVFYEATGAPKEPLSPEVYFKFQYGHLLEAMFLYLAKESGHSVTDEQLEVTHSGITGHIDAIIDGVLVDVKSASPYGYLKFADGSLRDNDGFNYIPQLASYYQALGLTNGAAFIAIEKVSGKVCLCKFSHEEMMAVDIERMAANQKGLVASIGKDGTRVPKRCYPDKVDGKSGNMTLGIQCSYCAHKIHCWRDANSGKGLRVFLYASKPKFLTKVVKEPRVFEGTVPEIN